MQLEELMRNINFETTSPQLSNRDIHAITADSRKVEKGSLFVALRGEQSDGHDFINDAITHGAAAVVATSLIIHKKKIRIPKHIGVILVDDSRAILGHIASKFFNHPSKKLRIVGITGTNGKTTTTNILAALLEPVGKTAVLGTVELRIGNYTAPASMTTPDPCALHSYFKEMLDRGAVYCAMEVSSHALSQSRVDGVNFYSAIFTNLTQDHLDYHKNMESYFDAKSKLFRDFPLAKTAVMNIDDPYGKKLMETATVPVATYGFSADAMFRAEALQFSANQTKFLFVAPQFEVEITMPLLGRHNIYNFLAAAAIAVNEGISKPQLLNQASKLLTPRGRLEEIMSGEWPFKVFVDYAHSPDAMEKILLFFRSIGVRRIIVVFGCGGDRDRTKRPIMGHVAEKYADIVILTSDNPRSEKPESIVKDIKEGLNNADSKKIFDILDRREAIQTAINMAGEGDIIAILGKGHESVQIIGEKRLPFSDQMVTREILKERRLVSH